jgi:N-acylneuraminate cytidylyltransferase
MKILCIIPARSGSKGIPHKNIKLLNDKPLFIWSVEQAQKSKYFSKMKIIISTDSEKYRNIANKWGIDVPFLRPKNISGDFSVDIEFIKHATEWLFKNENYISDFILHLRPTQPFRSTNDIDYCINIFMKNFEDYDSLRTVTKNKKSPFKMYKICNNSLIPLFKEVNNIIEPYNVGRQLLPDTYLHNGYIDIIKTKILKKNTISGNKIYPVILNKDIIDIDTDEDWIKAQNENKTIFE